MSTIHIIIAVDPRELDLVGDEAIEVVGAFSDKDLAMLVNKASAGSVMKTVELDERVINGGH